LKVETKAFQISRANSTVTSVRRMGMFKGIVLLPQLVTHVRSHGMLLQTAHR
jgi:hypothetical protein